MKSAFSVWMIVYALLLFLFFHLPEMAGTSGLQQSGPFYGLMVLDIVFILLAVLKAGWLDSLFASAAEDDDNEDAITADELKLPPHILYGAFLIYTILNWGYHSYLAIIWTGDGSGAMGVWAMIELVGVLITGFLWFGAQRHYARMMARRARDDAKNGRGGPRVAA